MRTVEIWREDGRLVCTAELANNPFTRMRGLLGRRELPAGRGLLIEPCNSVHMFVMRFSIDVVYIDKDAVVVKAVENLKVNRFSAGGRKARSTLDLRAGTIRAASIASGDRLTISREGARYPGGGMAQSTRPDNASEQTRLLELTRRVRDDAQSGESGFRFVRS